MERGHLSSYFEGLGWKKLSSVEINPNASHQHEFAAGRFRSLFGEEKRVFETRFIYLGEEEDDIETDTGTLTYYDSREHVSHRGLEWRLYYTSNTVTEMALEGDLLIIAKCSDSTVLVIITDGGSTYENQIKWLFGIGREMPSIFTVHEIREHTDSELQYTSRLILEMLGFEAIETDENYLELLLDEFDGEFPKTAVFSAFARDTLKDVSSIDDADGALMVWLEREEMLFKTLERHIVAERLKEGFEDDVDEFIRYSLSVQNRRKSRAGHALENHLEQVFADHPITYSRGQITERKSKPDFIFPSIDHYRDDSFPATNLTMLGSKSTCKDRWRQILSEADRINLKHLLTLEPAISTDQTDEMEAQDVHLVIPRGIQATYEVSQQDWLMDLKGFIELVTDRQPPV